MALDAGVMPEQVAAAAYGAGMELTEFAWFGNESNMWDEWVQQFRALADRSSDEMHRVAEEGIAIAARRRDRARVEERHEAVYGRL